MATAAKTIFFCINFWDTFLIFKFQIYLLVFFRLISIAKVQNLDSFFLPFGPSAYACKVFLPAPVIVIRASSSRVSVPKFKPLQPLSFPFKFFSFTILTNTFSGTTTLITSGGGSFHRSSIKSHKIFENDYKNIIVKK